MPQAHKVRQEQQHLWVVQAQLVALVLPVPLVRLVLLVLLVLRVLQVQQAQLVHRGRRDQQV